MQSGAGGRGAGRRKASAVLFLRVTTELRSALEAYVERSKPEVTLSAVMVTALEEFLDSRGARGRSVARRKRRGVARSALAPPPGRPQQ